MTSQSPSSRLQLAQRFISYIVSADVAEALPMLSPAATYHVVGLHSLAGSFSTPEDIVNHLLTLAGRTSGTLEATKWDDWLVGDLHVAGLATVQMQAEGALYSGRQVFMMRFDRADLIDKITIFFEDAAAATSFFRK